MANNNVSAPNFRDLDKDAVARAQQAVQGGSSGPLTVPKGAKKSTDKKGKTYERWIERMVITAAYVTTTSKGLTDVTVAGKVRQSDTKANNNQTVWSHFYLNNGEDIPEGHVMMNDRSNGAMTSLLVATGLMPASGLLKASLLIKIFPEKGKPGIAPSPLVGKGVIVNVSQETEVSKVKDADGEDQISTRTRGESFLPDTSDEE